MVLGFTLIVPALAYSDLKRRNLQRVVFVHKAKPNAVIILNAKKGEKGHYKLIGAKWKDLPVHIEVNPENPFGLSEEDIVEAIHVAAEEWDDGAYSQWGGVPVDLFDDYVTTSTKTYEDLAWTADKLDGCNTIVWGDYPEEGVIAVTILWYSRATKEIVEFDIVLDVDFTWQIYPYNTTGYYMDLQNIVTHELGHGVGLDDVYQPPAYQETMYGYADYGEIIKRDLYIGDQRGITKLYG